MPQILLPKRAKTVLCPFHRSHREICTRNRPVSETKFLDDFWGPLCFTVEFFAGKNSAKKLAGILRDYSAHEMKARKFRGKFRSLFRKFVARKQSFVPKSALQTCDLHNRLCPSSRRETFSETRPHSLCPTSVLIVISGVLGALFDTLCVTQSLLRGLSAGKVLGWRQNTLENIKHMKMQKTRRCA